MHLYECGGDSRLKRVWNQCTRLARDPVSIEGWEGVTNLHGLNVHECEHLREGPQFTLVV